MEWGCVVEAMECTVVCGDPGCSLVPVLAVTCVNYLKANAQRAPLERSPFGTLVATPNYARRRSSIGPILGTLLVRELRKQVADNHFGSLALFGLRIILSRLPTATLAN